MSATTGPQASDEDKNEPEPQDVEKPKSRRKPLAPRSASCRRARAARSSLKRIRKLRAEAYTAR